MRVFIIILIASILFFMGLGNLARFFLGEIKSLLRISSICMLVYGIPSSVPFIISLIQGILGQYPISTFFISLLLVALFSASLITLSISFHLIKTKENGNIRILFAPFTIVLTILGQLIGFFGSFSLSGAVLLSYITNMIYYVTGLASMIEIIICLRQADLTMVTRETIIPTGSSVMKSQLPNQTQQTSYQSPKLESFTIPVSWAEVMKKDASSVCRICKGSFQTKDEILKCPHCESFYHKNHLISWLEKHTACPVCRAELV